jgi:tetratricopeptide (TPR) repeat protein
VATMRRALAEVFNALGSHFINRGRREKGRKFYLLAGRVDSGWSTPWYNLGLDYKNCGEWEKSQEYNQRAAEIDPKNEAAWWNLGIAATALKNWPEARRAWKAYGISLENDEGEVLMPAVSGCVRLDPKVRGEVVWGIRLDPARTVVLNVPLPESGYRFHDIILNDGAPSGNRVDDHGNTVSVLDELAVWQISEYSTFAMKLSVPDEAAEKRLVEICSERELGVEDWSTVRLICTKCSYGNPGPHDCSAQPLEDGTRRFGFGAKTQEELMAAIQQWVSETPTAKTGAPELLVSARPA